MIDYSKKQERQGFTGEVPSSVHALRNDRSYQDEVGLQFLQTDIEGIGHPSPEDLVVDVLDIEAALMELTDREADVILDYYYRDLSIQQIADLRETSKQNINQIRNKALEKLRVYFS